MACYAALTSLFQTLDQIPQQPVQEQITSLQEKVSRLLAILEDSSQKNFGLSTLKDFEGQIRDVSYKAEDIIESHISRQVLSESLSSGASSYFWEITSAVKNLCERSGEHMDEAMDMEFQGLEKIIDEFESILETLSDKIKDGRVEDLQQPRDSPGAGSSRFVVGDKSTPVGLDVDLLQLKDRLAGSTSKLDIISIVGMGGIGKTTLARSLYTDPLMEHHFDARAWIVVSQEYHVRELLTGLLDSTRHGGGELHQKSIQQLSDVLYKSLKGRRYLIVMDDVWDIEAWDKVRRFFPDDNNGSRIILTTRLSEVAIYAKAGSAIHHMSLLSSEASWNLLHDKVFGSKHCPSKLEEIGKKIAENCKGLPLAIIVVGGLLSKGSMTRDYWEYIAENGKLAISGSDDLFIEILSLSYNSLTHHLKVCFLYMGIFPEDHVIFISQLIKLWIAEGFVKPQAHKRLEEVAEDYLQDLIDRNLIMVHKRNHNGRVKTCIIHDMLRELCVKKAEEDKLFQIIRGDVLASLQESNNKRRLSIHSDGKNPLSDIFGVSSSHSLLYLGSPKSIRRLAFIASFRLLRVLDVLRMEFFVFANEILELVHLRYVALAYRGKNFPTSLSKLRNLQTLIFFGELFASCEDTFFLPLCILEMPKLRHLILFKGTFLPDPFSGQTVGKDPIILENLQTLSNARNFNCTRQVIEVMPNLRKLGVSYFRDEDNKWLSFEFNNFVHLQHLETLKCLFIAPYIQGPINLAFPPSLRKLTLRGCRISWEKMTVIGSLPNLEVLKLKDHAFDGSVWEPTKGEFSKLKFLLIRDSPLEHWSANYTHFPRLQHLRLISCSKLVEIPLEIGDIPTLELIELCECSRSAVESVRLIQEEQQSFDPDSALRVRIYDFDHNYYFSEKGDFLWK